MKKLTAGIFAGILAIVSVNAARADIATTNYVNQNVDNKVGDLGALTTSAKDNAVAAINEVKGSVDTVAGNMIKTVADITEGNKNSTTQYPSMAAAQKIAADAVSTKLGTLPAEVEGLTDQVDGLITRADNMDTTIEQMDGTGTGTTAGNGMVKMVTQTNGTVTATRGLVAEADLDTTLATKINAAADASATTEALGKKQDKSTADYALGTAAGGWKALTDAEKAALQSGITTATVAKIGANETAIGTLNTTVSNMDAAYKAADTAINNKIGTVAEGKTVVEMISDAQSAATYDDTQVKADIKTNADAIKAINDGAVMTSGITAAGVAQITTNKTDIAGLKTNIGDATSGLTKKVNDNASAITTLNGADTVTGSVDYKIKQAVTNINETTGGLDTRLDAAEETIASHTTSITNLTNNKANSADVYTKTEIDGKVTTINEDIAKKVTATNLSNKLLTTTAAGQLQDAASGLTKPSDCGTNGITCMLINDGTGFKWEKVVDTYKASTGA